jgi:predicted PurR-regulated permease PerM
MDGSLEHKAFLLLLAIVTLAFFWLLKPFYGAVLWAATLAVIFNPLQRGLERRLGGRRNVAAFITVCVCICLALVPLAFILGALVNQGAQLVSRLQSGELTLPASFSDLYAALPPWTRPWLDRIGVGDIDALRGRLTSGLVVAGQYLAERALNVGQNTLGFLASLGIMLYVLFFLFRDGQAIGRNIRRSLPLSDDLSRRLLDLFAAVARATVKGNLVIALIQGAIGGVTFWLLGIEGALLWGVLMVFMSILPVIGSAIVWAPMAVVLILGGAVLKGVILILVGVGVIGLVDNLLRPPLVGKDTRLPDYVVLVSTVGGLAIFGINGFVIGPLIAALFVAGWTVFRDERYPPAA